MTKEASAQSLHDRPTCGEPLTESELDTLREEISASLNRLREDAQRIQAQTEENEALRREINTLSEKLTQAGSRQAFVSNFEGFLTPRLHRPTGTHMTKTYLFASALLVLLAFAGCSSKAQAPPRLKVVAYVPNWNNPAGLAKTIDYAKITHLNIAFENPINDVGDLSFAAGDAALIAAAHAHHVPVLLSIAGGGVPDNKVLMARYSRLLSAGQRARFVAKIAAFLTAHKFDGLDVDLEGPAIGPDYGAFVHDLSLALKPQGKLLTAALSQGYGGESVPVSVFADLDWVNIMAYDATGPWNPDKPGPHSSLAFAKSSTAYWLGRGLPKSKAVLGLPFYGYGFGPAFRAGGYTYAEIVAAHPGAENTDEVGQTIYYNGLPTIRAKTQYARGEGLAGVMVWSIDQDAAGDRSLLSAIDGALQANPGLPAR